MTQVFLGTRRAKPGEFMMKRRQIGETDLEVSELGLGTATLAGIFRAVSDADAAEITRRALAAGINYVDTAPFYGHGLAEHRVGTGVRGQSDTVVSTKVGRLLKPGKVADPGAWADALPFQVVYDYSYDGVMRSFEDSFQRLGRDTIEILYLHDIGDPDHGTDDPELFKEAMDGGYCAMDELRRAGDVKAIGLGTNFSDVLSRALDHGDWDVSLLAGRYTLLEQAPLDDLFPKCEAHGCQIVMGGPFNSGVLAGGDTFNYAAIPQSIIEKVKKIKTVADEHKVPLGAAALAFCRAHPLVVSTIPGPREPDEITQILEWWDHSIPQGFWSDLKSNDLLRADAPTGE